MGSTKHTRRRAEIGLPQGNELIWSMIQKVDPQGSWTILDIALFSGMATPRTRVYVMRLQKAGFVAPVDDKRPTTRKPAQLYRMTRPSLVAPRLTAAGDEMPEMGIETIWRTIRMLKSFSIHELTGYLDTPEVPVNKGSVRTYVSYLQRAGIVCREAARGRSDRIRLVKQLGPRAPRVLRSNIVYDPNGQSVVGVAETSEVAL